LHLTPHEKDWWNKAPHTVVGEHEFTKSLKSKPDSFPWYHAYDQHQRHDGQFEFTKREMPHKSLAQVMKTRRDVYDNLIPNYNETSDQDKRSAARAVKHGMSGFIVSDEGDVSIAHAHPHHPDKVHLAKWLD
jgi:hypothetical protein